MTTGKNSEIKKLADDIAAAAEPSRELDCRIALLCDGFFEEPPRWAGGPIGYGFKRDGQTTLPGHGGDQLVPRYTASVDDAETFRLRNLPDTRIEVATSVNGVCEVEIATADLERGWAVEAKSEPLARIAAAVDALAELQSA